MFAPKTGKQGTKGDKLIYEENVKTIAFYQKWVIVSTVLNLLVCVLPLFHCSLWDYFWCVFLTCCNLGAWCFMRYVGKPTLNPDGSLVHSGADINSPGSLGDQMKDVVITTSVVQTISCLFSNYLVILWTFIPGRAFYLLWVYIIHPYITSGSGTEGQQDNEGIDPKKQKKQRMKVVRN
ncbi:transmembrane protein 208-like [Symsagittifera roscoffensis]|uniref:transmembrane protein 208-like n=1 Tax=Symsagittifera roscoffensis TaxID=84072 RepID=UPI00307B1B60